MLRSKHFALGLSFALPLFAGAFVACGVETSGALFFAPDLDASSSAPSDATVDAALDVVTPRDATIDARGVDASPDGVAACTPEANAAFCTRLGQQCGTLAGKDNCGKDRSADCGACAAGQTCGAKTAGVCDCSPESSGDFCTRQGKNCGSLSGTDNCGASRTANCGNCSGGAPTCTNNVCTATPCTPESDTAFCARQNKNCGALTAPDNCGTVRSVASCGTCGVGQTCGLFTANVCGTPACVPEGETAFCSRLNKACGAVTAPDNCGTNRTVASCGTCTLPQTCGALAANSCGCVSESDSAYCSRLTLQCGSSTGPDNCGQSRTVTSCGPCPPGQNCSANHCACTGETNSAFCNRLGFKCGAASGTDNCGKTRNVTSCGTCGAGLTCLSNACVAASDGGADASADAASDAGVDAMSDAGADTGTDATVDATTLTTLRIYVAGESIEQFNRFTSAPFNNDGTLNGTGNDTTQYGWMVPLADRLRVRGLGLSVVWVGQAPWITRSWATSDGTYPSSTPGRTSAMAGTQVTQWVSQYQSELSAKTHCYDIAFASRGGNDLANNVSETTYKNALTNLIRLLDAGSSCRTHPIIYVTGHMPDSNGWNYNTDVQSIAAWNAKQLATYVTWPQAVIASLRGSDPAIRMIFVDQYAAFMNNQATTAFPSPNWLQNGGINLTLVHIDGSHPLRLASIYAGEIAANAILLSDLGTLQ